MVPEDLTIAPTIVRRENNTCQQLAGGTITNFQKENGNTAALELLEGATYIFSWAMNEVIKWIRAWRNNGDGTYTIIQSVGWNSGVGTMSLNIAQAGLVHFQFEFDDYNPHGIYDTSGEFGLFLTANGGINPPVPTPEPPTGPGRVP